MKFAVPLRQVTETRSETGDGADDCTECGVRVWLLDRDVGRAEVANAWHFLGIIVKGERCGIEEGAGGRRNAT